MLRSEYAVAAVSVPWPQVRNPGCSLETLMGDNRMSTDGRERQRSPEPGRRSDHLGDRHECRGLVSPTNFETAPALRVDLPHDSAWICR
jgi:hypothetical protein